MKPYRVELTNCLVIEYKMHKKMNVSIAILSPLVIFEMHALRLDLLPVGGEYS